MRLSVVIGNRSRSELKRSTHAGASENSGEQKGEEVGSACRRSGWVGLSLIDNGYPWLIKFTLSNSTTNRLHGKTPNGPRSMTERTRQSQVDIQGERELNLRQSGAPANTVR